MHGKRIFKYCVAPGGNRMPSVINTLDLFASIYVHLQRLSDEDAAFFINLQMLIAKPLFVCLF